MERSYPIAIERCVFSGKLVGGSNKKGVFYGWGNNDSTGSTVTDCLYLMQDGQDTSNLDIAHEYQGVGEKITFTRCYKTTDAGTYGTRVYTDAPAGEISEKLTLVDGNTYYRPCTVSVSGVESSYQLSASPSINPTVTIDDVAATYGTDYTAELNGAAVTLPYTITAAGDYTLTLKGTGNYAGEKSVSFIVLGALSGEGSSESPYLINGTAAWETLAQNVNSGTDYSGKYFEMTSDVSGTSMVGTSETNAFKGTFLGGGHTLTITISEGASNGGTAPFHYINGATIKNLTVAGTINSAHYHAAGLVGYAYGTNLIEGCTVTATINQNNDYAGGIIGHGQTSNTTVKDCVFAGTINGVGGDRSNIGGFWGWSTSGTPKLQNCLEKGTYSNISTMHPIGLQGGTGTLTDCYYLTPQIGSPSNVCTVSGAHLAYTTAPDTEITRQKTLVDGVTYSVLATVSGIEEFYLYTGSAFEPEPVVTWNGTTLTKDTHYSVAYANNTDKGTAIVTITAKGDYSGVKTVSFLIGDYLVLRADHTTLKDNYIYKLTSNLTFNNRITVNGTATLILNDGCTLTANKGIELTAGNQLTIEGETNNSGTLICKADQDKSGIGAYRLGTLIINGGTINATGGYYAAGIGGGYTHWQGQYGQCPTLTINGGQITATGGNNAPGIGPGYPSSSPAYNPSGTVRLGWTNVTDFIKVTGNGADYGFGQRIIDLGFVSGKGFRIDGSNDIATTSNIKGVHSLKLLPANDVLNLTDKAENTTAIAAANTTKQNVVLTGRTLYKDGKWNTICLPFNVTISGSPLADAEARTVTGASISGTTLNLTFGDAVETLSAGTPYIIKWTNDGTTLTEANLVFNNVTIDKTTHDFSSGEGDTKVSFMGTYDAMSFTEADQSSVLLLTTNNLLRYVNTNAGLGACRAYFKIGENVATARQLTNFDINFGDVTGIGDAARIVNSEERIVNSVYDLQGRQIENGKSVNGKLQRGVYIVNGMQQQHYLLAGSLTDVEAMNLDTDDKLELLINDDSSEFFGR